MWLLVLFSAQPSLMRKVMHIFLPLGRILASLGPVTAFREPRLARQPRPECSAKSSRIAKSPAPVCEDVSDMPVLGRCGQNALSTH